MKLFFLTFSLFILPFLRENEPVILEENGLAIRVNGATELVLPKSNNNLATSNGGKSAKISIKGSKSETIFKKTDQLQVYLKSNIKSKTLYCTLLKVTSNGKRRVAQPAKNGGAMPIVSISLSKSSEPLTWTFKLDSNTLSPGSYLITFYGNDGHNLLIGYSTGTLKSYSFDISE